MIQKQIFGRDDYIDYTDYIIATTDILIRVVCMDVCAGEAEKYVSKEANGGWQS